MQCVGVSRVAGGNKISTCSEKAVTSVPLYIKDGLSYSFSHISIHILHVLKMGQR